MDDPEPSRRCREPDHEERIRHRRELSGGDIERRAVTGERSRADDHGPDANVGLDGARCADPDDGAHADLGELVEHDARRRAAHPTRCADDGRSRRQPGDEAVKTTVVRQQVGVPQMRGGDLAGPRRVAREEHERWRRSDSRRQIVTPEPDVVVALLPLLALLVRHRGPSSETATSGLRVVCLLRRDGPPAFSGPAKRTPIGAERKRRAESQ